MPEEKAFERVQHVIAEAEEAIRRLRTIDESVFLQLKTTFEARTGKIILTGVGKSGYIAMKVAATLTSLGSQAFFVHPIEALHGDSGAVGRGDVILAFSFSGNTKELLQFIRHAQASVPVSLVAITGGLQSELAERATVTIPISIEKEGCPLNLAPMASTTAMLVAGDAIAALITSPASFSKLDFARFHPSGSLGLSLTSVEEKMAVDPELLVSTDTPAHIVLEKMTDLGKGIIGVVSESGQLVGSVTDGDVRRFFLHNPSREGAHAHMLMSTTPKSIHKDSNLKDALSVMEVHKITSLFVLDGEGRPAGIIHIHDILGA